MNRLCTECVAVLLHGAVRGFAEQLVRVRF